MKQTYTGISIVFASLLLATSSLVSTAEASLTEQVEGETQTPSIQVSHTPIEEHVLEDGSSASAQSGGWFNGWFGGSKPSSTPVAQTVEAPKEESTGWFGGWFSGSKPSTKIESESASTSESDEAHSLAQTASLHQPSATPTPSTSAIDDASNTAKSDFEKQLALYAQSKGRPVEDLMQSIMIAQPSTSSVDALTDQLSAMKISARKVDSVLYIDALDEQPLDTIKDAAGISVPLFSKIHYYVQHRESKAQKTEWLTGAAIFEKLISTPSKKYTVLKIAENASHDPIWETTK